MAAILGLNFSRVYEVEKEEKETLLKGGAFVYSTTSAQKLCTGTNGIKRVERRIVGFCGRFFLLRIVHRPVYTSKAEWRIYGRDGYGGRHDGHVRRISSTDDSREDEVGERVWFYDNSKFEEPEVEWATDSLRQMTWAERSAIKEYRKLIKENE